MIEIRTWEGDAASLAGFVESVWREAYQGRMPFPIWSAAYLDWQLNIAGRSNRHLLAAYEAGQLAGVILGWPSQFQIPSGIVPGLTSSWLSVAKDFRGRGIVRLLKEEQQRRVLENDGRLILSYRYIGSRLSLARPPADAEVQSKQAVLRKVGFWVRILDGRRAAGWYLNTANRVLTQLSRPLIRRPGRNRSGLVIRPFESGDAEACLRILAASNAGCELAVQWTAESLTLHCSGFGRSYVAVDNGTVRGFVAFHVLTFSGRTEAPVGIFDLMEISGMKSGGQQALLNAALHEMVEAGAVLALKLRVGEVAAWPLLAAGFIPWFPDSYEVVRWLDAPRSLDLRRPQSVLWR